MGGLSVKDVVGIVVTYVGTKVLGAVPLKPAIGVNIQGTPAMSVDLFAVLGGLFPNLSAVISSTLSSAFDSLAVNLGLDPKNLFMSSPLGSIVKDINAGFDQLVLDFKLDLATSAASVGNFQTAAASLTSAVDQCLGLPSTAWQDYAKDLITFGDPAAVAPTLLSEGAQALNPGALVGNLPGLIENADAIESCLKPGLSVRLLDAAQADFKILQEKVTDAISKGDFGAQEILKKEFTKKLEEYTKQMDGQLAAFEASAADISKKLNATANMSAQIVPPSINIKGADALLAEIDKLKDQYTPSQIAAAAAIADRWKSVVSPVFTEQVLPVIDDALAMEANTSKTATDRLATASADVNYTNGYPDGVNVRYDTA